MTVLQPQSLEKKESQPTTDPYSNFLEPTITPLRGPHCNSYIIQPYRVPDPYSNFLEPTVGPSKPEIESFLKSGAPAKTPSSRALITRTAI